jgi:hypothetical protein
MPKKSEDFVFVATDGRFMAIVEHPAKTRLLSHVQLATTRVKCITRPGAKQGPGSVEAPRASTSDGQTDHASGATDRQAQM